MSVDGDELLLIGELLEGITVWSMDGAMVGREESSNDVGMSVDCDELLLIGELLEGITVWSMDGTIVGREEALYNGDMPVDGDEVLLLSILLEGNKELFAVILLLYIEGTLEAL